MSPAGLSEDYHGRYWARDRRRFAARCAEGFCLWNVLLARRGDGWWWTHDHSLGWHTGDTEALEGGPFEEWQLAAAAAVERGHAKPIS